MERAAFGVFRYDIGKGVSVRFIVVFRYAWPSTPGSQEWLRLSRACEKALVLVLHAAVDDGQEAGVMVGVRAAQEQIISWEDSAEISK